MKFYKIEILIVLTIIAIIVTFAMSCGSQPEQATKVLTKQGYTDIQINGYAILGCDKGDTYRTKFNATAPNGSKINGVVCAGWFKGNTVRITD